MHSKQADTLTNSSTSFIPLITETQITEKPGAGSGEPSGLILHGTPVLRLMSEPSSCVFWTQQFPEIIHFTVCSIVTLSKYQIGASQTLRRRYPHTITRFLLVSRRRKRGSNSTINSIVINGNNSRELLDPKKENLAAKSYFIHNKF